MFLAVEWWRPRILHRPKSDERGWLPIPLQYIVALWVAWFGAVIVVGVAFTGETQTWIGVGVILVAWGAERRLQEPVAAQLGTSAKAVRAFDVHRPMLSKVSIAAYAVSFAGDTLLIVFALSSSIFQPDGVGVAFGLALLWFDIVRDVLSRLRWQRSRRTGPTGQSET